MKEEITKVLNDNTFTTTDERVEAITKALGPMVVPKDVFNDTNTKLKTAESELVTTQTEFNNFKQSKMTDDEKAKAQVEKFENDKKDIARTKSELAIQKLLMKNGIEVNEEDTELNETIQNLVSEDMDKSIKLANNFINLLNKTKDNTKKETVTDLLNSTPKPDVGNPNAGKTSNLDQLNTQYAEAIKSKDFMAQTRLMRLIQEEQAKKTI